MHSRWHIGSQTGTKRCARIMTISNPTGALRFTLSWQANKHDGNNCASTLGCQRSERHGGQAGGLCHHPPPGHCLYHCRSQTNPCGQNTWMSEEHKFNTHAHIRFQERICLLLMHQQTGLKISVRKASHMTAIMTEGKHAYFEAFPP